MHALKPLAENPGAVLVVAHSLGCALVAHLASRPPPLPWRWRNWFAHPADAETAVPRDAARALPAAPARTGFPSHRRGKS